ncbi:MAG TPA: DUF4382 domain-containing protein [Bdellovibrionota bacterium]|nr:DUF4382 domain-containing protein [Bdellovibrionota bacterium]
MDRAPLTHKMIFMTLAMALLTACQSDDSDRAALTVISDPAPRANHSKLRIALAESAASTPYLSAQIRILRVDVHSSSEDRWYRIPIEALSIDLMNLGSDAGRILARAKAPAGTYDQVRLVTEDSGSVTRSDGSSDSLRVPSGAQTGIKFHFEPGIVLEECGLTDATIELDTSHSFVETAKGVSFKPVVHARSSGPVGEACPGTGGSSTSGGTTGESTSGGTTGESTSGGTTGESTTGGTTGESTTGGTTGESTTGGTTGDGGGSDDDWINVIGA